MAASLPEKWDGTVFQFHFFIKTTLCPKQKLYKGGLMAFLDKDVAVFFCSLFATSKVPSSSIVLCICEEADISHHISICMDKYRQEEKQFIYFLPGGWALF